MSHVVKTRQIGPSRYAVELFRTDAPDPVASADVAVLGDGSRERGAVYSWAAGSGDARGAESFAQGLRELVAKVDFVLEHGFP